MTGPPIFLICTARSGSTLLRRLLDAHPLLACPPETNLGESFATIDFASRSVAPDHKAAEAMADELVRNFVDLTLGAYARRAGKPRWCDKSLTAVNHLD